MPTPEPFTPTEREYYENFKALVRAGLPGGGQLFTQLHSAYEQFFQSEGIILSRRERYRLFLLIMEEIQAELQTEVERLHP